ncbi:hypothetical protein PCANC_05343 [Puccinia coronata f. sp. avenae]|uniref:Uncharacterized protein n=1 Tax=Puccinia coronata f. sp. avenae TaxID=200324 RepID=A0A2N5VX78_9BASI|nr:hypothetical protein PCASD_25671 [Puccinia coronata f. sp. avenae]PLW09138.1 hypothetical protein PCANC_23968 [Puccinia coronata f. sp. avenae]PLW43791.1 hypothetical protein PCASD_09380 [Puccinia coronata f. sp. avenae]PLW54607.1 hypothetical protein PCANC_05343 [Puccinia coronata f. sp. avenae]
MRKVFVYVLINEEAILAKLKWASRPDHFRRRRGIHDLALNLKDIENPHDRLERCAEDMAAMQIESKTSWPWASGRGQTQNGQRLMMAATGSSRRPIKGGHFPLLVVLLIPHPPAPSLPSGIAHYPLLVPPS